MASLLSHVPENKMAEARELLLAQALSVMKIEVRLNKLSLLARIFN